MRQPFPANSLHRRWEWFVFYVLFFLSGASGLAFQMAWSRMLTTGLGHEMPAVLAVVAAIFAGMAAGAWASERLLSRRGRPGRWYGRLEVLIGLWGLLLILFIPASSQVALTLTGLEPSAFRHWLVGFVLPIVVLLPATAAMGATFPVLERFLTPLSTGGRCVGALYAANTFGGVAGILLGTFWVLPAFGYSTALAIFSAVCLGCGLAALALEPRLATVSVQPGEQAPAARAPRARLAWVLAITGLLGIGYEVLGVRVLAQVLENTIYTFAAVLSVYLLATAAGAAIYQVAAQRVKSDRVLPGLLLALSIVSLLGAWGLSRGEVLFSAVRRRLDTGLLGNWSAEFVMAGLVFALPALLMGATFAHLVQSAKKQGLGVGQAVALNTLGSGLAPLIWGVLLLPALGAKWSFVILGLTYAGLAWPVHGVYRWLIAAPILLALALPSPLLSVTLPAGQKLLAYHEGIMDSVFVVEHLDGNRSLLVNNRFNMGGTGAALAERRHASIPLLLHAEPRRALFLGLGTGITFAAAGAHPELRAEGVELVPEIVRSLPWFEPHSALPQPPGRFKIYVADARRFVQASRQRYDVIVADLFHPARDGAGALYSLEHFRAVRSRLEPGGLFCQWLPLYQFDEPMLRVVTRTFLEVFPESRAFLLRWNVDTPVLGLIGASESRRYRPDYFSTRVQNPLLRERLGEEQLRNGFDLFGCFLAGPEALRRYAQGAVLNTDDHPVVLFGAPRFNPRGDETPYGRLTSLLASHTSDPGELIELDSPSAHEYARQLADFIQARTVYLKGLMAEAEGQIGQALEFYVQSARLSQRFSIGYARALTLAMQQVKDNPAAARAILERLAEAQPSRPVAGQLLQRLQNPPLWPDADADPP